MYRKVLANRQFLKLWGAQLSSQIAAQLLNYALLIRVFQIASGTSFANSSVSLLIVAIGIPAIILAVPAGAYVDHHDRKTVLVWTNAIRALLVPLFIVLDTQIIAVYILALIISVASQFFVPAEGAALPKLVHKNQLVAANSLFVFTLSASFIIGYSLAAPIIDNLGMHSVYLVVTIAFAVALLLSLGLPKMAPQVPERFDFADTLRSVRRDIGVHFGHIVGTRALLFPILLISIAQTIVGIVAALAPALAKQMFNSDLVHTSHWLIVPAGVGLVLGSAGAGWLLKRRSKTKIIYTSLFLAAAGLLFLSLLPQFMVDNSLRWFTGLTTFTLGVLDALMLVSAQTLLQYASTDRLRGQIFGTLNMMVNIAALLPIFLAGLLADVFSALVVLGGVGVALLVVGLILEFKFRGIAAEYA